MTTMCAAAAFALRLAYFALAISAIVKTCAKRGHAAAFALAANAALAASTALGLASFEQAQAFPWAAFAGLLAVQAVCAAACQRMQNGLEGAPQVLPFAIILSGLGSCLILDVHLAQATADAGLARWALAASPQAGEIMALASAAASRHIIYIGIGFALLVAALLLAARHINLLAGHAFAFFAASLVLLALPLAFGFESGGAKSWVRLGGLSAQPSELAKITLAVAAAGYLAANASRLAQFSLRGIAPIGLVFLISLATVALQRDLGCALILFAMLAAMLAGSARNGWVYLLALAAAGVGLVTVAYLGFDHIRLRFDVWLNPEADPFGAGFQHRMAAEAIANGGLIGCGVGHGRILAELPVAQSDFIFAVLAEELGLFGCGIALACYAGIAAESARCASRLPRASFERNLIAAVGALIASEAVLITAGVLNLIPLTGITLPLLSQGGSSSVSTLAALGLMMGAGCCPKAQAAEGAQAITAAKLISMGLCLALALCLAATVQLNLAQTGGLQLCGTTASRKAQASILSSDGLVLAQDAATSKDAARSYPQQSLACHVIGAASDGIEGRLSANAGGTLTNLLALPESAETLVLSLDANVQAAAEAQLAGREGAIVAIDPQTGRILAMASAPTYQPGQAVDESTQSLINRATAGLYSPGSTFKLVTLAAALEAGAATPLSTYAAPAALSFGNDAVSNFRGDAWDSLTLTQALNASANTAFAQLGQEIGTPALIQTAEQLGFNEEVELEVGASTSRIAGMESEFELAWASAGVAQGQSTLNATPLQMALVMCAIANEGTIMQPYLISSRLDDQGKLVEQAKPRSLARALSPETAQCILGMLAENEAAGPYSPYIVAGKTGTAESDLRADDAWYVCAASHEGRQIVVSCIVEQGGTGAQAALPRAAAVVNAAFESARSDG